MYFEKICNHASGRCTWHAEAKLFEISSLIKDIPNDRKIIILLLLLLFQFSLYSDFDYLDVSGQNIHWEEEGAFTAEISPKMLLEHRVKYAIVGHSEPRKYFSESDEQINKRAVFAQSGGLTPIVCGETLEQRERGEAKWDYYKTSWAGSWECWSLLIVAYEPIWAIGTEKHEAKMQIKYVL